MEKSSRYNHKNIHTIVLKPRVACAPSCQKNGLFSGDNNIIVHSMPKPPPNVTPKLFLTSPRDGPCKQKAMETFYEQRSPASNLLVSFGIDSYLGRMVTRVLILLILFQPVYVAMGMELEETPNTTSLEVSDTAPSSAENENAPKDDVVDDSDIPTTTTPDPVDTPPPAPVEDVVPEDDEEGSSIGNEEDTSLGANDETDVSIPDEDSTTTDEDTSLTDDTATGDESLDETTGEGTDDIGDNQLTEEGEDVTDEVDVVDGASLEEAIVPSDDVVDPEEEITTVQNSENKYTFGEGDCTLVADGEFYCVAEGPETQTSADPRVYAEKDREGDREIYYFDGVEVFRITNNSYDDFAPVFDDETLHIVWQAMLNDRLQIMVHEVPTNTTRQITTSRQNSSNPSIERDMVVWQEWVGTNWEIMMTDVDTNGQEFEIEQLTDNAVHDMFPVAYDGLVTWQRERGSSWEIVVYDLGTRKSEALKKDEDTMYENPRFVLMFDSKHENGDIETIGYDLDTGEKMELGTRANPQPKAPASPKDKSEDALPREENIVTPIKVVRDDGDGRDDALDGTEVEPVE